jgi:hypothetical protein
MRWPSAIIAGDNEVDAWRSTAGAVPQPLSEADATALSAIAGRENRSRDLRVLCVHMAFSNRWGKWTTQATMTPGPTR